MENTKCKICDNNHVKNSDYCFDCMPQTEFIYYGHTNIGTLFILSLIFFPLTVLCIINLRNPNMWISSISMVGTAWGFTISGLLIYVILNKIKN